MNNDQSLAEHRKPVRLHMTNIAGLGAIQLLQSLLPSFERSPEYELEEVYLPSVGELADYKIVNPATRVFHYKRLLPNALSRVLECVVPNELFSGNVPLLVMGDLPLAGRSNQTLFVQSPLLTRSASTGRYFGAIRYWIARAIFRSNIKYVHAFIVQTRAMKAALIDTYPEIKGKVHIIAQPAPRWLLESKLKRTGRLSQENESLRLFYPAAFYPHKNHRLLGEVITSEAGSWPISELVLTIPNDLNPNSGIAWIKSVGRLSPDDVISAYAKADALLFLSLSESFGFPLVEAMWIGLPVICPDRPYARTLCGEQGIYFDPDNVGSLKDAVMDLHTRLAQGWWPNWTENLELIPRDWAEVAGAMLAVAGGATQMAEGAINR